MSFLARVKNGFGNTFSYFADSWLELKKVKWPTRKELTSYTLVVLFMVVFVTLYFYVLDLGISELLRLVFKSSDASGGTLPAPVPTPITDAVPSPVHEVPSSN